MNLIARPFLAFVGRFFSGHVVVRGDSMLPTLRAGDYLMVDRLAYVMSEPRKGDVVVVKGLYGAPTRQIKRVVELQGKEVVVQGDNSDASTDSRDYGPIALEQIEGRAWFRYWPIRAFGPIP